MKTGRYSLKELLTHNEIEQIIIPEMQRDYVWEESNVIKLIEDINSKYEEKQSQKLEITINGVLEESDSVNQFLTKEFERLKYNQKLGFIYAYHDQEYAGKFFLIDGQQRLTTLFLMLLYLYTWNRIDSDDNLKIETFRNFYFKNKQLKVDYKVREQSHDFLKILVDAELEGVDYSESKEFYRTDYLKDITIVHLIENYNIIKTKLASVDNKDDLLHFLEDFVEFNYFDTHLSEQGEQLYIYMNSRGEQLSFQEIVRAELMKKVADPQIKRDFGKDWENWQNYFWRNKKKNENADKGFEEFLKWATIIHLAKSPIKPFNFIDDKDDYKIRQLKEFYVKQYFAEKVQKNQKIALLNYIVKNIDITYLKSAFSAMEKLFSLKTKYIPVENLWLSEIRVINYIVLLPLLQYLINNNELEEEETIRFIEKGAMFLHNITYFEAVSKNPDTFTLDLIVNFNQLIDNKKDIVALRKVDILSKSILTINEKKKLYLYNISKEEDVLKWQEFFWDITLDHELCEFLMGDSTVFFNIFEANFKSENSSELIAELHIFKEIIKNVVLMNRDEDRLRIFILCHYDYPLSVGSGAAGLPKLSFILNDNTWEALREWKIVIESQEFNSLLKWILNENNVLLDELLLSAKKTINFSDYRESFINDPSLLSYSSQKKMLKESDCRILLLKKINYSDHNAREIQCALLKNSFQNQKMWIAKSNCCVFDFSYVVEENIIINKKKLEGDFALDIVFNAESYFWSFTLFCRNTEIINLVDLRNVNDWLIVGDRLTLKNGNIYNYDKNLSLLQNNVKTINVINDLVSEVKILLRSVNFLVKN